MPRLSHSFRTTHPRHEVAAWHRRPGALVRATPHWAAKILRDGAVQPGAYSTLRVAAPGAPGIYVLPWTNRVTAVGEHTFTAAMHRGPLRSWTHTSECASGEFIDTVDYQLGVGLCFSERRLRAFLTERARRIAADLDFHANYKAKPRTVVVAGASGTVGQQVVALLRTGGHTVRTLVRRVPLSDGEYRWDPARGQLDGAALVGADAVIHLGGASIGTRFTEKNKQRILNSRVQSTQLLARAMAAHGGPSVLVVASASGFYGAQRPGELLMEDSAPGQDFLAEVCQRWEAAAEPARQAGGRVVHVRTGVVLSPLGGALALQLPAFLAGLGGYTGTGKEITSWISLDDIARVYFHALVTDTLAGPVNAVAPGPATAREVATAVGGALRRPARMRVPRLATTAMLGREGSQLIAHADQRLSCAALLASGYQFVDPSLELCLGRALKSW